MSLFKILKGSKDRIDPTNTPFHEGYAYFTTDEGNGGFYIDAKDDNNISTRYHINGTDTTLTSQGVAADAYATGIAISNAASSGGQQNKISTTAPSSPNNGDNWFVAHENNED